MRLLIIILLSVIGIVLSCKGGADNKEIKTLEIEDVEDTPIPGEKETTGKTIIFFGNSLTAGLGLDQSESFPSLIQDRLDSLGMDYKVVNAGISGETSSNGAARIDWVLQQPVDIFVLELGANDMLRGLELKATEDNLRKILAAVRARYPDTHLLICEMQSAPNMGPDYVKGFEKIYSDLAKEFDAGFIPFFLQGVADVPGLTLDGKHPTADGQKIVRDNIWEVLKDYL